MTIQNTTQMKRSLGNGAATTFPYSFRIPDADSIEVYLETIATGASVLIDSADYTVTGLGTDSGSVEYPLVGSAISSDYALIVTGKRKL